MQVRPAEHLCRKDSVSQGQFCQGRINILCVEILSSQMVTHVRNLVTILIIKKRLKVGLGTVFRQIFTTFADESAMMLTFGKGEHALLCARLLASLHPICESNGYEAPDRDICSSSCSRLDDFGRLHWRRHEREAGAAGKRLSLDRRAGDGHL